MKISTAITAKNDILSEFILEVSDYPDWVGVANINEFSENGYGDTLLHLAACQGRIDIMAASIKKGLNINKRGRRIYTVTRSNRARTLFSCTVFNKNGG